MGNVDIGVWLDKTLVKVGNMGIMQKIQKVKVDASYVFTMQVMCLQGLRDTV